MEKKDFVKKAKTFFEKNKRNCITGFVAAVIIILLIIFIPKFIHEATEKRSEDITSNTNDGIVEIEEFKGLKINDISLTKNQKNKQYSFTAKVTNITDKKINIRQLDIIFKNEKGEVLITLLGDLGENGLEPNASKTITASVSSSVDLSKATSKEIKKHLNH